MFLCGAKLMQYCLKNRSTKNTNLDIKCGKFIFVVEYSTIKIITTITVLAILLSIIYCLGIFLTATKIKLHIGELINMVSKRDGDVLPTLFALPALLCLLLNFVALFLIYRVFGDDKRDWLNSVMYVFILVCLATIIIICVVCVIILTHIYGKHEKLHDGIKDAMKNYSSNSQIKKEVDLMQIEFQCCGSKKYDEWYDIKWMDTSLEKEGGTLEGQTPFSCCSFTSLYPCIHHGIEATGKNYMYRPETNLSISTSGCHTKIKQQKQNIGWQIIGRLMLLKLIMMTIVCGVRFLQTGHYEKSRYSGDERAYTIWLLGCYAGRKKEKWAPPVPPLPPELQE